MTRLRFISLLAVLVFLFNVALSKRFRKFPVNRDASDLKDDAHPRIWALLVAGSNGWYNYRHQADVCHAFHVLKNHGIPEDRIITMMYDDIADSKSNPFPGKIFNQPDGDDVYKGVRIDYKGRAVTPHNFLAVLQGNASAVHGGNGRVIHSDGNDHIFVFFTDHGGTGLISFPEGILTVKELNDALKSMHKLKKFNQLVFYMEACESGSMFNKVLAKDIDIYAITAANEMESSWGCYCENDMGLPCMGDLFSVNWMNDSDEEDLRVETLEKQFEIVREETNKSHVMHYGDLTISSEYVADFQGWDQSMEVPRLPPLPDELISAWPVWDIPLLMLRKELQESNDEYDTKTLQRKIEKLQKKREYLENFIIDLVEDIVHDEESESRILNHRPHAVTQLKCHHSVTKAFHHECFDFNRNPYALKYAYVLANLCEEVFDREDILRALHEKCTEIEIIGIQ